MGKSVSNTCNPAFLLWDQHILNSLISGPKAMLRDSSYRNPRTLEPGEVKESSQVTTMASAWDSLKLKCPESPNAHVNVRPEPLVPGTESRGHLPRAGPAVTAVPTRSSDTPGSLLPWWPVPVNPSLGCPARLTLTLRQHRHCRKLAERCLWSGAQRL